MTSYHGRARTGHWCRGGGKVDGALDGPKRDLSCEEDSFSQLELDWQTPAVAGAFDQEAVAIGRAFDPLWEQTTQPLIEVLRRKDTARELEHCAQPIDPRTHQRRRPRCPLGR